MLLRHNLVRILKFINRLSYEMSLTDELEQTQSNSEKQGSLACCSSWGCKESDMTKRLNNNNEIL